ncbi:uncharacterized protein LOC122281298 isoform X4 [Carya illinoinensis]|uniref:Uncharacterized protein n=1 Tax=Carya illinoinensis TaxID=32201 RepID=A0A8T1P620_CARIL|nr:uncharacterized protein LOC122281298 isoform X4 [Carya illinoinensis]KAG6636327.1 hypothetical protein CIPAW_11G103800 [Carya illinoinensis]
MAEKEKEEEEEEVAERELGPLEEDGEGEDDQEEEMKKLVRAYLGLTFSVSLALLPKNSISLVPALKTQVRELSLRLLQAEEQMRQMKSRRKEDSKANARVVEIFASHRNAWQSEERRLLQGIEELRERMAELEKREAEYRARVEELEREVGERDEMISFMSRTSAAAHEFGEEEEESAAEVSFAYAGPEPQDHLNQHQQNGFDSELLASSASKFWAERANPCQGVQYESLESLYHMKHFVPRRESPWKVDGESTGVSSKLKLLEQELLNLVKVGKSDLSKVPSLMRKQAKRCQALSEKIDDLCRRMQASDPCEPTLSPEFQTQRQTEFLLEAFRLQQRASETGQKLMALQTEVAKSYYGDEVGSQAKLTTRRSLDSIMNNLKEIQRNLEIWLARIIGDLEGILARDGASRVTDYYISRYPIIQ